MYKLIRTLLPVLAAMIATTVSAQSVSWKSSVQHLDGQTYRIVLEASIPAPWHMYDMGPYEGGPNATTITFTPGEGAVLEGGVEQLTRPERHYDKTFGMEIGTFARKAQFAQSVKLTAPQATVKAELAWMICANLFKSDSIAIALYIGYYSGLRISEVLALEKSDFDFTNNEIHITKQLDCVGKRTSEIHITTVMKTNSSNAVIPLAEPLKEILMDWFEVNPYDHVICDVEGNYIHVETLKLAINKTCKKMGIYFHFHMLRHTFISNLANNGISPQIAKELARHSRIETTMDIYTHVNEDSQKQAINAVFNSKTVKKVSNASLLTN